MFATIQSWWERLKRWTVASTVGAKRETVESFLASTQFRDRAQAWDDYLLTHDLFPQILRGGGNPKDRPDQLNFKHKFPGWMDFSISGIESDEGKSWRIHIFVKEQGKDWMLTVERPWSDIEWREVETDASGLV